MRARGAKSSIATALHHVLVPAHAANPDEEHVPHGGLNSRLKELAFEEKINTEIISCTLKDEFIHFYGTHEELLEKHGLSAEIILTKLK